jgi:hypothetical protein
MKKRLASLLSVTILLLTSCSLSPNTGRDTTTTGIQITDMVTSLGGSETEQVVTYRFILYNGESVNMVVHWIEPELIQQVSERLLTPEPRVVVEKTIVPNSSLEISGEFRFENKAATKTEILNWGPLITGITLSLEVTLPLPGPQVK